MTHKTITIKDIVDEDFINYKKASMFVITSTCDFKCQKEDPNVNCQNLEIVKLKNKIVNIVSIIDKYIKNNITHAIIFGGLEPIDQIKEILDFISIFRKYSSDDIVIYTGYTEEELKNKRYIKIVEELSILDMLVHVNRIHSNGDLLNNKLIIKYGRFKASDEKIYDEVLGINLASSNQYAKLYGLGDI